MRQLLSLIISMYLLVLSNQIFAGNFKETERELNDAVITTKITAKFAKNKNLNLLKISVSTEDGKVTLLGHVKSAEAFVDALRLAKSTKGVRIVNTDHLDIKLVNTVFADAYITAKVETAILKTKVLDDESIPLVGINASTANGVVTLTGTLKNDKSIVALLKRISSIEGVKKIISLLKVNEGKSIETINPF